MERYTDKDMEYIATRIRELYLIVNELESKFVGRKFTLDGHIVGSIGEVIAAYRYGLTLLPASFETHDAVTTDDKLVQIKATQGKSIALYSEPAYLIVLKIDRATGTIEEVYNSCGRTAWDNVSKESKTGQRHITVNKLIQLSKLETDKIPQLFS